MNELQTKRLQRKVDELIEEMHALGAEHSIILIETDEDNMLRMRGAPENLAQLAVYGVSQAMKACAEKLGLSSDEMAEQLLGIRHEHIVQINDMLGKDKPQPTRYHDAPGLLTELTKRVKF